MRTEILQREIKNDRRGDPFSFRLPAFEVLQCLCDWEIIVNVDGVFSHLTELEPMRRRRSPENSLKTKKLGHIPVDPNVSNAKNPLRTTDTSKF